MLQIHCCGVPVFRKSNTPLSSLRVWKYILNRIFFYFINRKFIAFVSLQSSLLDSLTYFHEVPRILPLSVTSTVANSFTLALIILAASRRTLPLSIPDMADHEVKAFLAAWTALSTSGFPVPCVSQRIFPLAGSMMQIFPSSSLLAGSTRRPSMKFNA